VNSDKKSILLFLGTTFVLWSMKGSPQGKCDLFWHTPNPSKVLGRCFSHSRHTSKLFHQSKSPLSSHTGDTIECRSMQPLRSPFSMKRYYVTMSFIAKSRKKMSHLIIICERNSFFTPRRKQSLRFPYCFYSPIATLETGFCD
jgi:hypothetical protein